MSFQANLHTERACKVHLQPGESSGCALLQARVGKTQEQRTILLQVKAAAFPS